MTSDGLPASVQIFTFKEGLLSRMAHDLRLTLTRFCLTLEDGVVHGTFWPETLEVDGAMKDGRLDARTLGPGDRGKIQKAIREDVLATRHYPQARYRGQVSRNGQGVAGELTLCGRTGAVVAHVAHEGTQRRLTVELIPSQFGIRPYRALAGTLKVQDRVRVEIRLIWPPDADPPSAHLAWIRPPPA